MTQNMSDAEIKKTFTPDAHHQFRLYDGVNHDGTTNITDMADFDPQGRTVIILPGTRVNHEVPQAIVNIKFIPAYRTIVKESLARQGIDDAQIYCGVYGHNDEQMISDHYSHPTRKNDNPKVKPFTTDAAGTDVRSFVANILLPFSGVTDHAHPDAEQVAQRLSHLTLMAHSYGGTFAAEAAREFQFVLRNDHGYSRDEAARIASEIVVVGIAPVRDMEHERLGFRNLDFTGRTDASNLGFMRRVAGDHIETGLVPEDTDKEELALHYYKRSGYVDMPNSLLPPENAELQAPETSGNSYSQVTRVAMPAAIHWTSHSNKPRVMDQAQLDSEHRQLEEHIRKMRGLSEEEPITALNGADLIQYGLVPTHDHRMYLQPANENRALVQAVDHALSAAVSRAPQAAHADPSVTVAALLASGHTPHTNVNGTQHLARAASGKENGIG